MNSQDFFLLNIVFILFFLIWYIKSPRREKPPTMLDLRAKESEPHWQKDFSEKSSERGSSQKKPTSNGEIEIRDAFPFNTLNKSAGGSAGVRSLNIYFNFEGKNWDAYEVLGLPAGSAVKGLEAAIESQIERAPVSQKPKMRLALKALLEKNSGKS